MKQKDYNVLVNHNMLVCWLIISVVLVISYIIEVIKGLRTIPYVIIFSLFTIIPLIITFLVNKMYGGYNEKVKYVFAVGYLIFYTFTLITTQSDLSFVYIIPMISILLVYCDKKLISGVFSYATIINIFIIIARLNSSMPIIYTRTLDEVITFYEIQIACLVLSGIFLYKTTNLLIIRKQILDELTSDVNKDALTGLNNVRFLETNINKLFNIKHKKSLHIAFIDIDDFKHFNTLYGHKFGDEVLITLGKIIKNSISKFKDTYGIRVGGDEFVIISRSINYEEFCSLLEEIRNKVETTKLEFENKIVGICISIGAASRDIDSGDTFLKIYNLADNRNNEAKKKGKNTIVYKD